MILPVKTPASSTKMAYSQWFPCLQISQTDVDRGYVVTDANVTATDPDGEAVSNTADVLATLTQLPSISLGKRNDHISLLLVSQRRFSESGK